MIISVRPTPVARILIRVSPAYGSRRSSSIILSTSGGTFLVMTTLLYFIIFRFKSGSAGVARRSLPSLLCARVVGDRVHIAKHIVSIAVSLARAYPKDAKGAA